MRSEDRHNRDYTKYSFEDFLQDHDFVHSIMQEDEFWILFEQSNPPNLDEFTKACTFLANLPSSDYLLTDVEADRIWKNISQNTVQRPKKIQRYVVMAAAVAAILAILIWSPIMELMKNEDLGLDDLYAYANSREAIDISAVKGVQLILSDEKNIELGDQDDIVSYSSDTISVGNENISKREVSAYNEMIVPRGRRSQLELPDGTMVWINSGTRVIYPVEFRAKSRNIYVDGEIFLKVKPNKDQAFVVRTKDIDVEVLGTEFNVNSYSNHTRQSVVLASGSVQISNRKNKETTLLVPNMMYTLQEDGQESVARVNVSKHILWIDGVYVYNDERLGDILDFLSEYYDCRIEYGSELSDFRCFGKLEMKNSIEEMLSNLAYTLPIDYNIEGDIYKVQSTRK